MPLLTPLDTIKKQNADAMVKHIAALKKSLPKSALNAAPLSSILFGRYKALETTYFRIQPITTL